MTSLRLNLDTTDFDQLVALGRALIPTLAPSWTDHNAHDPGIMLLELLAFIADAQIYSLARVRRDERRAYGKLLGLGARGPVPAHGLVWPGVTDLTVANTMPALRLGARLEQGSVVLADHPAAPAFSLTHTLELTTAVLVSVATRFADGSAPRDWTRINTQRGASYEPFAQSNRRGDRLELRFRGPLVDASSMTNTERYLSLGVELVSAGNPSRPTPESVGRLIVALEDTDGERPLSLVHDTTYGLLQSGVLLLRVGDETIPRGDDYRLTIRSAEGEFLRSPRLRCIALNVLPIVQRSSVLEIANALGTGLPNQQYQLGQGALMVPAELPPLVFETFEDGRWQPWHARDELGEAAPDESAYALDPSTGELAFGNGVNGRAIPSGAAARVSYEVSAGSRGNLAAGLRWSVQGLAGPFGTNTEATVLGEDAGDLLALRASARRSVRVSRPLVSAADVESAALEFTDLGVQRALELVTVQRACTLPGARTLIAVGSGADPDGQPESARWLKAIRERLALRLPLGQRLEVVAPRYKRVRVRATLVAAANLDPKQVAANVTSRLATRLALVPGSTGDDAWPFGRELTPLTVQGWLRSAPGVVQLIDLSLLEDDAAPDGGIVRMGRLGLPKLELVKGDIVVLRAGEGNV